MLSCGFRNPETLIENLLICKASTRNPRLRNPQDNTRALYLASLHRPLDDEHRAETLAFLERIGATYVTVDAPKSESAKNLVPTVPAVTSPTAYVRFHGRNLGTWNKRGGSAAERFDYLYSEEELAEWVPTLKELAGRAQQAFALFNNNATAQDPGNPLATVSQAATNAFQLRTLLA